MCACAIGLIGQSLTMAEPEKKRKRKANFSENEVKILLEEISIEKDIIQSSLSDKITNKKKQAVWQHICQKVNACGVAYRTITELKDKWGLLKRAVVQKKADLTKTGGGKGMPPPEYEEAVVSILGDNTTLIGGIEVMGTVAYQPNQDNSISEMKGTVSFQANQGNSICDMSYKVESYEINTAGSENTICNSPESQIEELQESYLGAGVIASSLQGWTIPAQRNPLVIIQEQEPLSEADCIRSTVSSSAAVCSTPKSLSTRKTLQTMRKKKQFKNRCDAENTLLNEYLRSKIKESTMNIDKMTIEKDKLSAEKDKLLIEQGKMLLEKEKLALEIKLLHARVASSHSTE